ncbi:MAG: hypothetical protein KDC92_05575, partial [Bacteroidetes bacterium]|nr:hypothetical protein [Bacteroidota bacterium]
MLSSWRYISSLAFVFTSGITLGQTVINKTATIYQEKSANLSHISGDLLLDGEIAQMDAYVKPGELSPSAISFKNPVSTSIPPNAEKDIFIETSLSIINDLNGQFKLTNVSQELECLAVQKSKKFTHVIFKQKFQGIDVYGGQIKVHYNEKNELFLVNSSAIISPTTMSVVPTYSAKEAILLAGAINADANQTGIYQPSATLVIGSHFGLNMLCWKVNYLQDLDHNWEVLIAAHTGTEILRVNTTCHGTPVTVKAVKGFDLRKNVTTEINIETYKIGNTYYLYDGSAKEFDHKASQIPTGGGIMVWDARKTNKNNLGQYNFEIKEPSSGTLSERWNEIYGNDKAFQIAATCQSNLKTSFNYYANGNNIFKHRGFDGINSVPIKAYVNVGGYNQAGSDDALWFSNGIDQFMVFGSGRYLFKQLGAALDIVAHEYTHAVVEHCSELGRIIKDSKISENNKSLSADVLAINEAIADIMALVISGKTLNTHPNKWQIGSEAIREDINGKKLSELKTHFSSIDPTGILALSAYPYSNNAMRDIADPHNAFNSKKDLGFHCKHTRDIREKNEDGYSETFDIYHRSTIISHAFYRLVKGLDNKTDNGIAITKDAHNTAGIFLNAVRYYLNGNPTLLDFALAVKYAYIEEYGFLSTGKN